MAAFDVAWTLLSIRRAPASRLRLCLTEEPPLALRWVDPRRSVAVRPRSMIDPLALGVDVALDRASLWGELLGCLPPPGAVLPWRLCLRLPNADVPGARLQGLIVGRILEEGPGQAGGDEPGADVGHLVSRAFGDQAAIVIKLLTVASNRPTGGVWAAAVPQSHVPLGSGHGWPDSAASMP